MDNNIETQTLQLDALLDSKIDYLVSKITKYEQTLESKLGYFEKTVTKMGQHITNLGVEVEELKKTNFTLEEKLSKTIHESLKGACDSVIPVTFTSVMANLDKRLEESLISVAKKGLVIKNGLDVSLANAEKIVNRYSKKLTRNGMVMASLLFVTAISSAACIGYYFPRHVVNEYGYNIDKSDLYAMVIGDIYIHDRELWTKQQQEVFNKKFREELNDRFHKYEMFMNKKN